MEVTNLSRTWNWLYNLAGRLGGPRRSGIRIIGGADGPTAIFVAGRGQARPKLDNGVVSIRINWREAFAALGLALGIVASLALLFFTLYQTSARKR